MAAFTAINTLTLGNTFGAWYAKTNDIIDRLNLLKTASITGGDGIKIYEHPSSLGGFTAEINSIISKNMTFNGNVTINGVLNSYSVDVSGLVVNLPYSTGITFGNIVYLNNSGILEKALANDECTSEVVGIVVGFTGSNAQVATTGKISGSSTISNFLNSAGATLQKGIVYFLSSGISGAGTTIEPVSTQYVSKPVLLGLTSDIGLILPYRGYIANSGYSLGTLIGACGGFSGPYVRTLNGPNATLLDNDGNLITSGDLAAVNVINYLGNYLSGDIVIDRILKSTDFNEPWAIFNNEAPFSLSHHYSTNLGTYINVDFNKIQDENRYYEVFATSGSTFDVWRLKTIKCLVTNAPKRSFSFVLNKTANRLSCTSYINNQNKETDYTDPHPGLQIQFSSKTIRVVTAGGAITGANNLVEPVTNYTVLSAVENTPYFTVGGQPIDGVTTGLGNIGTGGQSRYVINQDSSGKYAIIYGTDEHTNTGQYAHLYKRSLAKRVYTWNVNSVVVGGLTAGSIGHKISKGYDALIQAQDINASTNSSGVTLDMSLLGWNQHYGAVSESLTLELLDFPEGGFLSPSDYSPSPYQATFFFEFVKFNPNTQVEDQNTTIIPIDVDRMIQNQKLFGRSII